MKKALSERQSAVLEVMSKPKTPAEIRHQIGLSRSHSINSVLKELRELGFVCPFNRMRVKVGRLYGLTPKGTIVRESMLTGKTTAHSYLRSRLNWSLYGWVVSGKQRKAILKALNRPMPLKYIKERAQEFNPRISRTNTNDILQLFVQNGTASKIRQSNRVIFALTKKGEAIRKQLFLP